MGLGEAPCAELRHSDGAPALPSTPLSPVCAGEVSLQPAPSSGAQRPARGPCVSCAAGGPTDGRMSRRVGLISGWVGGWRACGPLKMEGHQEQQAWEPPCGGGALIQTRHGPSTGRAHAPKGAPFLLGLTWAPLLGVALPHSSPAPALV